MAAARRDDHESAQIDDGDGDGDDGSALGTVHSEVAQEDDRAGTPLSLCNSF